MKLTLIGVAAGLTLANFAYQLFGAENYATAFERSFFQVTALWIFAAILSLRGKP